MMHMDITPYVESLRHDLAAAAEAGGAEAKAAAERLALALDPAMRLALMDALSQAAAEITAELPAGSLARITLRTPESVKYKAEELAAKGGHSLNSWIVNVVRAATRDRGAVNVDIDLS